MTIDLRLRVVSLIGLAVLGVGLAVVGTSVGATSPLATSDSGTAFVISEQNITLEHGGQQATVVNNMSGVDHIEIERQGDGAYRVHTDTEQPISDSERRLATTVARNNATVSQALAELDRYELTVEPIRKLTMDSAQTMTLTGATQQSSTTESDARNATYSFSVENQNGSVTVDRDPTYVEDEVSVRIRDPRRDELYYAVTVDLHNETVTAVTDWRDI